MENAASALEHRRRFTSTLSEALDPLGDDQPTDGSQILSPRQLGRLLLVATEVGARFQREHLQSDALAWMYAPRRLFRGLAAVDAVADLENCWRAFLLHGFGIGLDADPDLMDELCASSEGGLREELVMALLVSAED